MTRGITPKTCSILLSALAVIVSLHAPALASPDEDLQTLGMFYDGNDLIVSATRNPKPISQTAENVTVITTAEIEMMGAHTLADVLNNVPGIQIDDRGSVGTFSGISIHGADMFNILVLQDGITLNFASDGSPDIAAIPVQHIERVEIVKGPGSSSWGSALGGIINIVTKSPIDDKKVGGALSFSAGERGTRDSRGETAGTVDSLGYYLYAENLTSSGFRPITAIDANNLYGKLRWSLPEKGSLLLTLAYTRDSRGEGGDALDLTIRDHHRYCLSTLSLNYPLADHVDLDLSFRGTRRSIDSTINTLSGGDLIQVGTTKESTYGGSAKVLWRQSSQNLVMGADLDHINSDFHTDSPLFFAVTDQHFRSERWGVFFNDTLTFGPLAITPGIRYDQMRPVGDFVSPSFGAAWNLDEKTTLRAYAGWGYSLPVILPGSTQEKVFTVQTGIETTRLPYIWIKTTLFRNQISDHQSFDAEWNSILVKQLKQGAEVEAKTIPLFNTSLSAGYTFVDARSRDSGEILRNIPSQIVKLGLHYEDNRSFRGALLGRYVWWNGADGNATKDKAIIWDLNLAKKVFTHHDSAVELFFNAHNIFNGAQFNTDTRFENARRWLEGGIKFNF